MAKSLGLKRFPSKANIRKGWEPAGQTATRKPQPLWKRKRGKLHADWATKADPVTGKEEYEYKILPATKEKLFRKRALVNDPARGINDGIEIREETFFLADEGNGNVRMQKYVPPTAEELAIRRRKEQAKDYLPELVNKLIEQGLSPAEAAARLMNPEMSARGQDVVAEAAQAEPETLEVPEPEDLSKYPIHKGGKYWILADGTQMEGKREDAEAANEEVILRINEADAAADALKDWQD